MAKKIGVSSLATVFSVLVVAGAYSLWTGRSPAARFDTSIPGAFSHYDRERIVAAARNPGNLKVHPDPLIGYVLKAEAELDVAGSRVRTDSHGLRARPGPSPRDDAIRIVVLGDSVAFGQGLGDDECLAHQLETLLRGVRGSDARPVVCHTVAVPGWNYRSAIHYLMAHYDRFRPDLVLYLPIQNDLGDIEVVLETGHRGHGPNLGADDPWLCVNFNRAHELLGLLKYRVERGEISVDRDDIGPCIINADLGGESSRRFDRMADCVVGLHDLAERNGGRLAVVQYRENPFTAHLLHRLWERIPDLPAIFLLESVEQRDTLGDDPHPNAHTVRTLAIWLAEEVFARGWIDRGAGAALPEPDPELAARRAATRSADEVRRLSEATRREDHARLGPLIDFERGFGLRQVYGGLSLGATVGPRLLAALAHVGDAVRIEPEPVPGREDFYPITLSVRVNGRPVGEMVVGAPDEPGAVEAEFPIPGPRETASGDDPVPPIEVELVAPRWMTIAELGGLELATCKLRQMECSTRQ